MTSVPVELPLEGECLVLNPPGHSRWAFDLLAVEPGSGRLARDGLWPYLTGRLRSQDLHGWGVPVRSPVDGTVLAARDGDRDREDLFPPRDFLDALLVQPLRHRTDPGAMAGNHVVVESVAGYVLLAHLRRGSVRVRAGQPVRAGDVIGEVGSSGNAAAPHLHLQVMDGGDPVRSHVVRFVVGSYEVWDGAAWQKLSHAPLPARRTRVRPSGT